MHSLRITVDLMKTFARSQHWRSKMRGWSKMSNSPHGYLGAKRVELVRHRFLLGEKRRAGRQAIPRAKRLSAGTKCCCHDHLSSDCGTELRAWACRPARRELDLAPGHRTDGSDKSGGIPMGSASSAGDQLQPRRRMEGAHRHLHRDHSGQRRPTLRPSRAYSSGSRREHLSSAP